MESSAKTHPRRGSRRRLLALLIAASCGESTSTPGTATPPATGNDAGFVDASASDAPVGLPDASPDPCSARFPADARFVDVRKYGAIGDGIKDDTEAIRSAIQDNVGTFRTVLLPRGTYLVRQPIDWKNKAGLWRSWMTLQGEGRGCTIVKVADAAPAFGDPNAPAAVFRTGSKTDDPACSNFGRDGDDGGGNCAFGNYVFDLTIDTGKKNAGSIGIDYTASNYGALARVDVRSGDGAGVIGVRLERAVGPALVKDVAVFGFDTAVAAAGELYGITLEHLRLESPRVAGIRNRGNMLAIRDVKSHGAAPAVVNESDIGTIVLVEASLGGGAPGGAAIVNAGVLVARDIHTDGFKVAIRSGGVDVPGRDVVDYTSSTVDALFPSGQATLRLPIEETPTFDAPLAQWANVESFGAIADDNGDDSSAFQRAIDSGAAIVYAPFGRYVLDTTVVARGNVRRIAGMFSDFVGAAKPAIRVADLSGSSLVIDRTRGLFNGVAHDSRARVAIVHSLGSTVDLTATSGPLFLEDSCCAPFAMSTSVVWARQWNVEAPTSPRVDNAGGTLWILGMKTEGTETVLRTSAGGRTELLGGLFYATGGPRETATRVVDAQTSMSFVEVAFSNIGFASYVTETLGQTTKTLDRNAGAPHGLGRVVPLFRSGP